MGLPYESSSDLTDSQRSASRRRHDEATKKAQVAAKVAFIDRCLRDLDILIYCELSALYYMDCSIVLFTIRAIVQLIFFTPKAPPFDPTRNQPYVGAIFASNFFCMFSHNFFTHPEAGEATREYLHGGLFIDFIGEKAPVSVLRLISLDIIILFIDFIMMGLIIERVKTVGLASATADGTSASDTRDTSGRQVQDHDSEERGVLQRGLGTALAMSTNHDGGDVDSNGLGPRDNPARTRSSIDERLERTELLAGSPEGGLSQGTRDSHALDSFFSGEAVIMDMGLISAIREQWRHSPAALSRRTSYLPSDETASFLRERFGLQVTPDGRVVRIER
ncbi:hypothetical protein MPDQ_004225 [Monascus purpureus]|uniref:DUF1746 domain-containing protein n=1 Tax=Monascus purpureus TaxID=5098 RepID=A0A507R0J3_MONPU|nr:hypothetical protein MPDQ_004225 [Monascus purpureus]